MRVVAQTDNSSQAVDQLSKRLDELRAEMNKIEVQLSELRSAKGIPAPNAVGAPSAEAPSSAAPAGQGGTIQSSQPPAQGPTSRQVGEATSTYNIEDAQAAAPTTTSTDPSTTVSLCCPARRHLKIGYFQTDFIDLNR
jgi:hypothetical protein